jgi:hypothetical protein
VGGCASAITNTLHKRRSKVKFFITHILLVN